MPGMTKDHIGRILSLLMDRYGTHPWNWHTQQKPFEVLIGTVLSQRTRDEKTDEAAKALFYRYPSAAALAEASQEEIELLIKPVNYFKTKAQRIKEICRILVEQYSGAPPECVRDLMKLPGVGLKTASCVMVYGFRKAAMPVDTHVHRISNRIGFVKTRTPEQTEKALWKIIPDDYILYINELLVKHGQSTCKPATPLCHECPLPDYCMYAKESN